MSWRPSSFSWGNPQDLIKEYLVSWKSAYSILILFFRNYKMCFVVMNEKCKINKINMYTTLGEPARWLRGWAGAVHHGSVCYSEGGGTSQTTSWHRCRHQGCQSSEWAAFIHISLCLASRDDIHQQSGLSKTTSVYIRGIPESSLAARSAQDVTKSSKSFQETTVYLQ